MTKRILICNPFISLGGISSFTLTLGSGLKKKGNEIYFLATHYKGDQWDKAKDVFIGVFTLEDYKKPLQKIFQIIKFIGQLKPDVIIINDCPLVNYSLPFIKRRIKAISVIHSDAKRYYSLGSGFSGWLGNLVCPSPKVAGMSTQFLPESDRNKVLLIPHGVKISGSHDKQNRIRNSLIFIGNLDYHKGARLLPVILGIVEKEFKDVTLFVVGKGPLKSWLKNEIDMKNLTNNFQYTPELNTSELYNKLSRMDILLLPTRLESFGLVIPEAMVNGVVPVISCLEGITDQFVQDGENGFLCNKNNPDDFAGKIIQIFKDGGLKVLLSDRARLFAEKNFPDERMIDQYQSIIAESKDLIKPKFFSPLWITLYLKNVWWIFRNNLLTYEHPVYR